MHIHTLFIHMDICMNYQCMCVLNTVHTQLHIHHASRTQHCTAMNTYYIRHYVFVYPHFMHTHTHSLVLLQFDASVRAVLKGLPFLCPSPETRRPLNRELLISSMVAMAQSHTIAMMSL